VSGLPGPAHLGDPAAELAALRRSATLVALPHLAMVSISGPGATDWCGQLVPGGERQRPGEGRHTLVLDDDGTVLADAWLVAQRESIWLIADGLDQAELLARCRAGAPASLRVEPLAPIRAAWTLDGPFAWEVMARYDSPGVIGLPPMTWFSTDDGTLVLRTGRTGEYGYLLLVRADQEPSVLDTLTEAGAPVELTRAGTGCLATAALENFAFWPQAEGRAGLTPLELQLQWRLPTASVARGTAAVRVHRNHGWTQRIGLVHGPDLQVGDGVHAGDQPLGRIIRAEPWSHGTGFIGLALLARTHAHPGFTWQGPRGPVRTLSAPLVTNRSLFVRPQRHAWQDQADIPSVKPRDLDGASG